MWASRSVGPRVWVETFNKPDFERMRELKSSDKWYLYEGEMNIQHRTGLLQSGRMSALQSLLEEGIIKMATYFGQAEREMEK